MIPTRRLSVLLVGIGICLLGVQRPGEARENNSYRAGYVMGYQEQASAKAADPTLTYGRYAVQRREVLKQKGDVPINFHRGLKDGFRDAVRKRTPEYTIEDVDLQRLPPHLHPKPEG